MEFAQANIGKRDANNTVIVTKDDPRLDPNYGFNYMLLISIFNIIVTLVNISLIVLRSMDAAESYWNSQWAYIDSLFCVVNVVIIALVIYYKPT